MRWRLAAGVLGALLCAVTVRAAAPPALVIENLGQYPLREVRLHGEAGYLDSPNLLAAPLPPGEQIELSAAPGRIHVTVFRDKVTDGPVLALTTAYAVELVRGRYVLEVFDHEFRLRHFDDPADGADATGCALAPRR